MVAIKQLLKLKAFIQDKLEAGFPPEIAKEISRDLNIVSREIDIVDGIFQNRKNRRPVECKRS